MTELTDTATLVRTAQEAAAGQALERSSLYAFRVADRVEVVDTEKYASTPHRSKGTVTLHDADSLVRYLSKHALDETEIYADVQAQRVVAVINAHQGAENTPGWGDHRATLTLGSTPAWKAWSRHNGLWLGQLDFAEHVEDRIVDFVTPSGADMLELAQSFTAHRSVRFESSRRTKSGETTLVYKEDHEAAAGKRGDMAIPDAFELGLVPFEGSDAYKVTARLRYRISDGDLRLGYVLDRPEDVLRAAFLDVVLSVELGTGRTAMRGTP